MEIGNKGTLFTSKNTDLVDVGSLKRDYVSVLGDPFILTVTDPPSFDLLQVHYFFLSFSLRTIQTLRSLCRFIRQYICPDLKDSIYA